MAANLEVLFAPAEFAALAQRDLSRTTCVVFDILRATSTIVTALANGANAVVPVSEIPEALAYRRGHPECLLAGEREGLRIRAELTGGVDFDLGNSPREFTNTNIRGKTIVLSTTNGSRALRACAHARTILVGSFLNLSATADFLARNVTADLLLVCSGTGKESSYEDVLGAGALVELLQPHFPAEHIADSAITALHIYQKHSDDLNGAVTHCRNGRRLMSLPELREDVAWCLQRNIYSLVAKMENDSIRRLEV
jgi:2-phosphosulfolactate phosphatase